MQKWLYGSIGAFVLIVVVWSLLPKPLPVDKAVVGREDFVETIVEDGMTRTKERFVVSSPVNGVVERLFLEPGDEVKKGQRLITIHWDKDLTLTSPADGRILKVMQESKTYIPIGTPILEIGDSGQLEIVADILTTNAVLVKPGQEVIIENWGGEKPLLGKVRLVEPSAFTKVSALGVDEQRVNVVIDITSDESMWKNLGDRYRVECHIIIHKLPQALVVPTGALFQKDNEWTAFKIENGKAVKTQVSISRRGPLKAVVQSGLTEGDKVILYPGDKIQPGVPVKY
ncbi:MAG: HlyD family efflux transporter periplasmic adaptor subunit [Pseudobdellovibrionaceae bacterium]|nr:HlyD family efflux transporter periplasmic adaptor subunit [Bdellovibrionales bacterium]USN46563.1 MAG: HlyD family efflux transporter periplasmic adaptor subunit [Pseudobdellovibrionaceae bacterium]